MKKEYFVTKLASLIPINSLRLAVYRAGGYKIGRDVKIARTAKILAKSLEIRDYSRIADHVFVGPIKKLKIGEFSEISHNTTIDGNDECEIGNNCFIGINYYVNIRDKVVLEDNVALGGSHGQLWTHSTWAEEMDWHGINKIAPVYIEKNSWIASGSTILPGIRIGQGSVIGTKSLVNKDVPAGTLAYGIPAKHVDKISNLKRKPTNKEKKEKLFDMVEKFVGVTGRKYIIEKEENTIFVKGRGESIIISLNEIDSSTISNLNRKTGYFDIKNKRCSKKHLKLETAFRRFVNYYFVRFKSE